MKYVSLTFDDGRNDNYYFAHSILRKYNMGATLFCTTGFIDGSFKKPEDWKSAGAPLTIEQIKKMSEEGWEIALHGDQHITELEDCLNSIMKIRGMGFESNTFGFSVPNSEIPIDTFEKFKQELFPNKLKYIRCGRAIDTSKISSKLLFAAYTVAKTQKAFYIFNKKQVISLTHFDASSIPSVVIRYNDDPKMILRFLENIPDNTWVVFMFHSILPKISSLYGSDPWNWSTDCFEHLLTGINNMKNISVKTMSDVLELAQVDGDYSG